MTTGERGGAGRGSRRAGASWSVAAVGLLALTLAGCAPGSAPPGSSPPQPTPPASSTPTEAEAEAYEGALAAVQNMTQTAQALLEPGAGDPSALEEYATGEALKNQLATIQQYRDQGMTASGQIVLEPLAHTVSENDDQAPAVPDGEAVIQACVDYSQWRLTGPDGSVEPFSGSVRSTFEYHVRLDTVVDRWQVHAVAATGQDC